MNYKTLKLLYKLKIVTTDPSDMDIVGCHTCVYSKDSPFFGAAPKECYICYGESGMWTFDRSYEGSVIK